MGCEHVISTGVDPEERVPWACGRHTPVHQGHENRDRTERSENPNTNETGH